MKTKITLLLLTLLLNSSNPAFAFEPLSLATAVISPVICKIITCKKIENKFFFIENPKKNKERLFEIRDQFHWESEYEEGECLPYTAHGLKENGIACYIKGKWIIQNASN